MSLALEQAQIAAKQNEVPVGAVLVETTTGKIIASTHNLCEKKKDPTAHAELLALQQSSSLHHKALTLYVTLEPCPMCAGAIIQCQIESVVYGADDPKAGAAGSVVNILQNKNLDFQPKEVIAGIYEEESRLILKEFFKNRRVSSNGISPI